MLKKQLERKDMESILLKKLREVERRGYSQDSNKKRYIVILECHKEYDWNITTMCHILDIGRSSYYKWYNHRESSEEELNRTLSILIFKAETVSENILDRNLTSLSPNEKWLTDVSEFKVCHVWDVV